MKGTPSHAARMLHELHAVENAYDVFRQGEFEVPSDTPPDEVTLTKVAMVMCSPDNLKTTSLLWIADDMLDLLLHAAESLEPYNFRASALPWPRALVCASRPFLTLPDPNDQAQDVDIVGLQWSDYLVDSPGKAHVLCPLSHSHGPDLLAPIGVSTLQEGVAWAALRGTERNLSETAYEATEDLQGQIARLCCALWLLVQQRIATRRRVLPERAARRQWDRLQHRPLPEILVIELRKTTSESRSTEEPGFVDWRHRWIVDGHWRNQYRPSTGDHVPTWIAPYVKGPEDKPLLTKPRVHTWTR